MIRSGCFVPCFVLMAGLSLNSCQQAPVAETAISLESYRIEGVRPSEKRLTLSVLAAEPLINTPVAMDFDPKGRMWVVEMRGYMRNLEGTGEEIPDGRIVILEDLDGNGRMDRAKVFMDSLIMPRALAMVYGGILYAEPPNLWFVEIGEDDSPGARTLVDSAYAAWGNPEHMPNGLMLHLDNWIYNAKSNARYRRVGQKWVKEFTAFRGQWGITRDDEGRLFYNNNSSLLLADRGLPQAALQNVYLPISRSIDQPAVSSQKIFPVQPTAVNRGYIEGTLDERGYVIHTTSACGPVIYRGGAWPEEFAGNAFVCVPEANLIKRIQLSDINGEIRGTAIDSAAEFLTSTDQGFRPVNLYNGPDGGLYVVDMHRGIIQHNAYLTAYLKEEIQARGLDTIDGQGRILAVRSENTVAEIPDWKQLEVEELVSLLDHPNGWIRDHAQQHLIDQHLQEAVPALERQIQQNATGLASLHALWTLEGLGALGSTQLRQAMKHPSETVAAHAWYLCAMLPSERPDNLLALAQESLQRRSPHLDSYVALALASSFSPEAIQQEQAMLRALLGVIRDRYPHSEYIAELAWSGLAGREAEWLAQGHESDSLWRNLGQQVLARRASGKPNIALVADLREEDARTVGLMLYRQYCGTCHGLDGMGVAQLAPPLYDSEYVSGSRHRLATILLHGMKGPLHIQGKRYEFAAVMPGMKNEAALSDQDIAIIMNYIRNTFATASDDVGAALVSEVRKQAHPQPLTEPELLAID